MISFWFRKSRKVVTMEALREEDTKGGPMGGYGDDRG